jgi:hypothetical protein
MIKKISLSILLLILSASVLSSQELMLKDILARADSVATLNDSITAETKYRFEQLAVFSRLNKDESLKSVDTTISIVTKQGEEELSRELLYSSKGDDDAKGMKKREKKISFDLDDPEYVFSLAGSDSLSYMIAVASKSSPPREGQYEGTITIDKQAFYTKRIDLTIPDPEGALQEFEIDITFEPREGGLIVPTYLTMRGYVRALLGIVKVRFAGEFLYSNYEILE